MQLKRVSAAVAMAVVAGLTTTLGPVASATAVDSTVSLPLSNYGQMVVSSTHLYFTAPGALVENGSRSEDQVVVTDLNGANATLIGNEPGAAEMALSSDESTLYVARTKDASIAVIDTATDLEKGHYSLGAGVTPTSIALAAGKIWFGYAKGTEYGFGSLDLGGAAPVVTMFPIPDATYGPRLLRSTVFAGAPTILVDGRSSASSWVRRFDVSGSTPQDCPGAVGELQGITALDLTPDGQQFVVAWDNGFDGLYSLSLMGEVGFYPKPADSSAGATNSVAVGADGALAIGVQGGDVHSYGPLSHGELRSFGIAGGMPADSVTWSKDQTRLYAVTAADAGGAAPVLHILAEPELATSTLSAAAPAGVLPGQQLAVTGQLSSGYGAWNDGTTVSVSRDGTLLDAAVPVMGDGSYSFSDTPPTAPDGTVYHYTVSYAGDAVHTAAQATAATTLARAVTGIGLSAPTTAVPGRPLTVAGYLSSSTPLAAGQTLAVSRDGRPFQTIPVQADGSFSFTDTPTVEGTVGYSISYAGDAIHQPSTGTSPDVVVSRWNTWVAAMAAGVIGRGHGVTVSGSLSGSPYAAGGVVKVVKTDLAHPSGYVLTSAQVAADGTFSFGDVPQIGGANSYALSYPGDISHKPGSAVLAIAVTRAPTVLSLVADRTSYNYGQTAKVTAHLGATYNGRRIALYAGSRLLKSGTVDSHGNMTAYWTLGSDTVFSAVFAGDWRYAPITTTQAVGTYVRISDKLVGSGGSYYGSTTYGGQVYRLYHHNVLPGLYVAVTPNKAGRMVEYQIQIYYSGSWRMYSNPRWPLSSRSVFTVFLRGFYDPGHRWPLRIRPMYRGDLYSNGDADLGNLETAGAWQYFMITR